MDALNALVKRLEDARNAYYETSQPIMTDDEYDSLYTKLESLCPNHPFFKRPGPVPLRGKEKLPIPMASLKKIKPDTWSSWKGAKSPCVLSEKLDGISALWCSGPKKLYLRGDGEIGQTISWSVPYIQGLAQGMGSWIVRGELICPTKEVSGTLARNWVNGILHTDAPNLDDVRRIRFVAYQVLEPKSLTRSQQFSWLVNRGFEVAWNKIVSHVSAEELSSAFQERRKNSIYTCDGIVVGTDTIPEVATVSEPSDAIAYKEISQDQCAETIVQEVEWSASKTGVWIPRLRLDPVSIGSATIRFCTAFHARYVADGKIGPGTRIRLRRSGDVIPTIDAILTSSRDAQMPPAEAWEWDTTETHALVKGADKNIGVLCKNLVSSCIAFHVEGFRDATAMVLCENGIPTIELLLKAGKDKIQNLIGAVVGDKVYTQLLKGIQSADLITWLLAAPVWPRGFGESKLKAFLEKEPSVEKWTQFRGTVKGLSEDSIQKIKDCVPAFLEWRGAILKLCSIDKISTSASSSSTTCANVIEKKKGTVCLSGFRDAVLMKKLEESGYKCVDTVTKSLSAVIVADSNKSTTKTESAKKAGIPIYTRDQIDLFLSR